MTRIPKALQPYIDSAYPDHVCVVGRCMPDGYAQITPRGSVQVYDDDHLSIWERGSGSTSVPLHDGTPLTIYFRNAGLRSSILPIGGIARFYGVAEIHKTGPIYEKVWERLIEPERERDPEQKGFAVLIKVERAEDLVGRPLNPG